MRPSERHFVRIKVYLLRDSETMLEVCDDLKSEVTTIGKFTSLAVCKTMCHTKLS